MNNIPSKSLSKSLLIATPLFFIIMAVLNTTNQMSYLFVLDFVNNIGGKADMMFLPTLQPQIHTKNFKEDLIIGSYLNNQNQSNSFNLPLVNMSKIQNWANQKPLVNGASPRWLVPIVASKVDSLIMVLNVSQQLDIGIGTKSNLQKLSKSQIAISKELVDRLGVDVGDQIQLDFEIKNLLNGGKLFQKFQDQTSKDEYTTQKAAFNISKISSQLYKSLPQNIPISEQNFQKIMEDLYESTLKKKYKIKYIYKENGLFPSALHNVILMEFNSFADLITQFIIKNVLDSKQLNIAQFVPPQYSVVWDLYVTGGQAKTNIYDLMLKALQDYCVWAVSLFKHRQLVYHPDNPLYEQLSQTLQKSPQNCQVIAIYPFYTQSLAIKYFFSSVVQIFEVITCMIFFYTMSLIMKQIYQQKQIEVGIWRTLGAGGVTIQRDKLSENRVKMLNKSLNFQQKVFYLYKILVKIGFIYYWFFSTLVSLIIYCILKYILIGLICQLLEFNRVGQNYYTAFFIFIATFLFCQVLSISHIRQIYNNPLAQTIKPVKRTFDEVKIRVIHLATFGLSSQMLLIAGMLVYYGVVSYYWIPFSILDNDGDLQVTLFNSIFIFMIFGAVILISVLQSRFQRLILRGICLLNQRIRKMKMIMLNNIKAKQYKNLKMSVIIAVTFAFLLFFNTGIKIQIAIVQSFIQRQIGSSLLIQNYQQDSLNKTKISNYLDSLEGIKYSWLSGDLNHDFISFDLVNQLDDTRDTKCQFKVISSNYLQSTFYKYYYPQEYMQDQLKTYHKLSNGIYDGFDSIYKYDGVFNNQSIGCYDPENSYKTLDPFQINVADSKHENGNYMMQIAPKQQIINFAASMVLKLVLGGKAGDIFKLRVANLQNGKTYYIRSKMTHSYKIGPGLDLLRPQAFITEEQAKYLYQILGVRPQEIRYEKLFIQGPQSSLKAIGQKILAQSPQHTQMFQMSIVSQSFSLLQKYLTIFILLITTIMGSLAILFIFLYTVNKCNDQAQMYKMLRAVGLPVNDIRMMIFLQILIRIVVSIANGIAFGLLFSVGTSAQIQQFLMLNTPAIDLSMILIIAAVMISIFCFTVYLSTRYLTKRTVYSTSK